MLLALGMEKICCWHEVWKRYVAGIMYGKDMLLALGIGNVCCWH